MTAPRLARGGFGENFRRGRTTETLITAPSIWPSCMWAMADSASSSLVYRMYAVPRLWPAGGGAVSIVQQRRAAAEEHEAGRDYALNRPMGRSMSRIVP